MRSDLHIMPPRAPLAMPAQNFRATHRDAGAPGPEEQNTAALWRALAFSPAMLATGLLLWIMSGWFKSDGISVVETLLLTLICFNFFWIVFTVSTALLGVVALSRQGVDRPARKGEMKPLDVALLVPICNEEPWFVMGNARSMLEELRAHGGPHRYSMFILSDTRDADLAAEEQASFEALRDMLGEGFDVFYRRRVVNRDRKAGNIAEWVENWGGGHDAMLVLDADSLMTGRAIARLSDALARDPSAGLIQSFPQLIGAQSIFARMQQFANGVYGAAFAEGMARWCGQEGNYWGHNAIIRTSAFAASAGLPRLNGNLIMSHDFVEASLLRRAGWTVRFLPRIRGSYEETPATLIDHILRDRRWCQGNLQHLRLLNARGFRAVSRFHLLHGAIGYLMSPIWFALLVMWALIGVGKEASVLTYFNAANPLMPTWPEMTEARHVLIIVLMYAMLLAPKLLGVASLRLTGVRYRDFGGGVRFGLSFLLELLLSILYAPILMVQQMIAVFRTVLGLQKGWAPQRREGGRYGVRTVAICHALETVSGWALLVGMGMGMVSLWLLPIAVSLALAIPLSLLSGVSLRTGKAWVGIREDYVAPPIVHAARHYRAEIKSALEGVSRAAEPAE